MAEVFIQKTQENKIINTVKNLLDSMVDEQDIKPNFKFLLKPNFVNYMPAETGVTTDLRIIIGVVEWLLNKNVPAKNILLAEAALMKTAEVFDRLGVKNIEQKYGISVINLELNERIQVSSPISLTMKSFTVPKQVVDSDIIINLPKLKTHDLTMLTLSMKNFFGFYGTPERKKGHILCIHDSIVEMYSWIKKNKKVYHIMDGIIALEGKHGPINGTPVELGLLIASKDAVSLDITCTKIVDYPYHSVVHLQRAIAHKLGSESDIIIKGVQISEIMRKFDMPLFVAPGKRKPGIVELIYNFVFKYWILFRI